MPQLQVLDYRTPGQRIAAGLGKGLGEGLTSMQERRRETDAIQRLAENYQPGMSELDFLQANQGQLPLDKASQIFKNLEDRYQKQAEESRINQKFMKDYAAAKKLYQGLGLDPEEAPTNFQDALKYAEMLRKSGGLMDDGEKLKYLKDIGVPENQIQAYKDATPGVKLEMWRRWQDELAERPGFSYLDQDEKISKEELKRGEQEYFSNIDPEFLWPAPVEGKSKREREKLDKRRTTWEKSNEKIYQDLQKSSENLDNIGTMITQLTELNDSGEVSAAGESWNVNPATGRLLMPSKANKKTQEYVKTVNQFLRFAKEQFGARVTNFEVEKYLDQLPTLLNSEEGRRAILMQMQLFNDEQKLRNQSHKDVLIQYGTENIQPSKAMKIAEDLRQKKENEIKARMVYLSRFSDQFEKGKPLNFKNAVRKGNSYEFDVNPENFEALQQMGWEVVG